MVWIVTSILVLAIVVLSVFFGWVVPAAYAAVGFASFTYLSIVEPDGKWGWQGNAILATFWPFLIYLLLWRP